MKRSIRHGRQAFFSYMGWLLVLGLGALGVWQFHNTEFYSRFDLVPGGRGDPRMITAVLEYVHQALRGHGDLVSPAFYYPATHTLGYADVFFTYQVLYDWLRQGSWDVFTSFQICVLTADILNYLCGFLFLFLGLRLGKTASALGAFLFAFNAPKFNQIAHAQLQCLFWLPLMAWCLAVLFRDPLKLKPWKAFGLLSLAAICFHLELLSSFYATWFISLWGAPFFIVLMFQKRTREVFIGILRRFRWALGGALGLFCLGFIPFVLVYFPVLRELGGKNYEEVKMMIPGLESFFWMGPRHFAWGWLWDSWAAIRNLPVETECRLGWGLGVTAAWIFLTWLVLRRVLAGLGSKGGWIKAGENGYFLPGVLATNLFILLAFQVGGFSLWWLVYEVFPGAQAIRAVSRYPLALALPVGTLLAFSFQRCLEKIRSLKKVRTQWMVRAGLAVLILAGLWEQVASPPTPAFSKSAELWRLEYLSQKLPASSQMFYVTVDPRLPYSATDFQIDAMLISAVRGIPTLNGYSGHTPSQWGLYKVRSAFYGKYVKDWVALNHLDTAPWNLRIDR